jgi:hypothetical protein
MYHAIQQFMDWSVTRKCEYLLTFVGYHPVYELQFGPHPYTILYLLYIQLLVHYFVYVQPVLMTIQNTSFIGMFNHTDRHFVLLCLIGKWTNGTPLMATNDPVVPLCIKTRLYHSIFVNHTPVRDAVDSVRRALVPDDYDPYPFRANTPESMVDKLRSIYATYQFRKEISRTQRTEKRDFSTYIYVPENDSAGGPSQHDREDHCHVLKRIWTQTVQGNIVDLNPHAFDQAMDAEDCIMTKTVLVADRKQSVKDAEVFFSYNVADWLTRNGFHHEGMFVQLVAQWHEASDGRGMSQLERSRYNYSFMNVLLLRWTPWLEHDYDFSKVDINRYLRCIYICDKLYLQTYFVLKMYGKLYIICQQLVAYIYICHEKKWFQ